MGQELLDRGRANDQMLMKRIHALGQWKVMKFKTEFFFHLLVSLLANPSRPPHSGLEGGGVGAGIVQWFPHLGSPLPSPCPLRFQCLV